MYGLKNENPEDCTPSKTKALKTVRLEEKGGRIKALKTVRPEE